MKPLLQVLSETVPFRLVKISVFASLYDVDCVGKCKKKNALNWYKCPTKFLRYLREKCFFFNTPYAIDIKFVSIIY